MKMLLPLKRANGGQVGYVSADIAARLADQIRRGIKWFAMVTLLTGDKPGRHGLNIALLRVRDGETVTLERPATARGVR
jgi:hypothetical protein